MTYFNTTNLTGAALSAARTAAHDQDSLVLAIYRDGLLRGPSAVWKAMQATNPAILLTSVRRSITNLTDAELLVKTDLKRRGLFGRPECVWKIA